MEKIKTAFIGVGYRGKQLLQLLQTFPVFEVVAVADPGIEGVDISGVTCYNDGDDDYLNMLDRHKPELVFVTSPWQFHGPPCGTVCEKTVPCCLGNKRRTVFRRIPTSG